MKREIIDRLIRGESLSSALYKEGMYEELKKYIKTPRYNQEIERISRTTRVLRKYGKIDISRERLLNRLNNRERVYRRRLILLSVITILALGVISPVTSILMSIDIKATNQLEINTWSTTHYLFGLLQTIFITVALNRWDRKKITIHTTIYTSLYIATSLFIESLIPM